MIYRKLLALCAILIYINSVYAQITTRELPPSFSMQGKRTILESAIVILTPPNFREIEEEDMRNDVNPHIPYRNGIAIPVALNSEKDGEWMNLPDGNMLWTLTLKVENALSLGLNYDRFWLPKDGKLFIYNKLTREVVGGITNQYLRGSKQEPSDYATSITTGDEVTLEYYQPSSIKEKPIISISKVYYGYRDMPFFDSVSTRSFNDLRNSCMVNINCPEGTNWQNEKRAIARINIRTSTNSYWGSGALINNTNNDFHPYFLTANHNLVKTFDAVNNSSLSTWIFDWQYEFHGCDNLNTPPTQCSTLGAIVKANDSISDFALLELGENPRNLQEFIPYYLGWNRLGYAVAEGVGIHHPHGDVKKISTFNNLLLSTDCFSNIVNNSSSHWRVLWSATQTNHGVTKAGSSGSPLLNNEGRIIGQLHSGLSDCSNNASPDWYGKFSVSWTGNNSTNLHRRLRDWLDPSNTNIQVLDGKDLVSISGPTIICSQATYTINNLPAGATVQWSASPGINIQTACNAGVVTPYNYVTGQITASIYLNGFEALELHKNITIGVPAFTISASDNCFYLLGMKGFGFSAYPVGESGNLSQEPIDYYWSCKEVDTGFEIFSQQYYNTSFLNVNPFISFPRAGNYSVEMYARKDGTCNSPLTTYTIYIESACVNTMRQFTLSPNPATNMVTLQLLDEETDNAQTSVQRTNKTVSDVYEIQLWSATALLRRYTTNEAAYRFSIAGLPKGLYVVKVIKGGKTYTQKLLKS